MNESAIKNPPGQRSRTRRVLSTMFRAIAAVPCALLADAFNGDSPTQSFSKLLVCLVVIGVAALILFHLPAGLPGFMIGFFTVMGILVISRLLGPF